MNNRKGCVIGTTIYNEKYGKKKSDKNPPYKRGHLAHGGDDDRHGGGDSQSPGARGSFINEE